MILIDMKMPKDCKDCNFYVPNPMEGILFCEALFNEMDVCIDDITGKRYVRCPLREQVTCKDCKHYGRLDKTRFYRGYDCLEGHIASVVPDKDYCSRAERRTDG